MFERYTEEARRSIFFARFEASVFGATAIDTEHLLLGILKADKTIAQTLVPFHVTDETIRTKIAQHRPPSDAQVLTSVDLPVSHQSKRVLAYGAEAAESLNRKQIGPEHLLLGLVREDSCLAAQILLEAGLTTAKLMRLAGYYAPPSPAAEPDTASQVDIFRDLTQAASAGELTPLIGREPELRRTLQILSRRTRNSVAIIGDPGVGKTALIEGFALHLDSSVIGQFGEYRVLQTDAASLFPVKPGSRPAKPADEILRHLPYRSQTLVCIEGLFDLALARFDWGVTEAWHVLSPLLTGGGMRCIATGTPAGFEATLAKAPDLAHCFEIVSLDPPGPDEAVKILEGSKSKYEQFHGVSFAPGAIEMAVYASGRFLPQRSLPDRALDLLDEAAAYARVRRNAEPPDVIALRKEIRQHVGNFQNALAHEDFTKARTLSDLEQAARQKLRILLEQLPKVDTPSVTREDIEQVAADRVGAPVSAIRAILAKKGPADLDEILARLAGQMPIDQNPWLPLLAAYIARASDAEIDALIEAIRAARSA